MPVPVQIASWALDGISLLATQKSVTDHGISIVAQKDCAMWRGLTEGELCRDGISDGILFASKEDASMPKSNHLALHKKIETKTNMQKTFYPDFIWEHELQKELWVQTDQITLSEVSKRITIDQGLNFYLSGEASLLMEELPASNETLLKDTLRVSLRNLDAISPVQNIEESGNYAVIGSFRKIGNAIQLVRSHNDFELVIVPADVNGRKIYRVVYGPVPKGAAQSVRKSFHSAGIKSSWLIWLDSHEYLMSEIKQNKIKTFKFSEVAYLAEKLKLQ